jgi:Beta-lactamase
MCKLFFKLLFVSIFGVLSLQVPAWAQCGKGGITCAKSCGSPRDVGEQQYQKCVANCEALCTCANTPKPSLPCALEFCNDGTWTTIGGETKGTTCKTTAGLGGTCNGSTSAPACTPLPPTFSISGTVSGLSGGFVTLALNNGSTVTSSGGSFKFGAELSAGSAYEVTVDTQPSGQTCSVLNGSGKVGGANVTNIAVSCVTPPDVTACDPNGCVSEAKICATVANSLNPSLNSSTGAYPVVGYVCIAGALPPVYGGMARTDADSPASPMSPYAMTNVASVSKTLTAVGVLQVLATLGQTIDSPIWNYLYSDWTQGQYVSQITFRDLLTHHLYWCAGTNACPLPPGTTYNPQTQNYQSHTECGNNMDYDDLKTMVAGGLIEPPSQVTQNEYGNCNFALFRELLPVMLGNGATLNGTADGPARATASANLYVGYMDQHVFQPLGVPTRGGGSAKCSPPGPGPLTMLSYPLPAGTTQGEDWGSTSLICGASGWELSAIDVIKVINDLANGNVLLTNAQRQNAQDGMLPQCLGWDCAVRTDCPNPYVCKNGNLDTITISLWTYAGILGCSVPVVVVVNSPTPPPFAGWNVPPGKPEAPDIIDLVANAYSQAAVPGTPSPCP